MEGIDDENSGLGFSFIWLHPPHVKVISKWESLNNFHTHQLGKTKGPSSTLISSCVRTSYLRAGINLARKAHSRSTGARSCISWVILTSSSEVPPKVASSENPPYFDANMMEIGGWRNKFETLIKIHQSQKKRRGGMLDSPKKPIPPKHWSWVCPLCQEIYLTWKDVCGVPLCLGIYSSWQQRDISVTMAQSIGPPLGACQFLSSLATSPCHNELLLWVVLPWTTAGLVAKKTWWFGILPFWTSLLTANWFSGRLVFFGRGVLWFLGTAAKQFPTWTAGPIPGLPRDNRPSSNCISRFLGVCTGKAMDESGFNHPGSSLQFVMDSSAV